MNLVELVSFQNSSKMLQRSVRHVLMYAFRLLPANFLIASVLFLFALPAFADDVATIERHRIAAIQRAMPATIGVFGPGGQGGGSGVVISPDGFALTNYHVVESCESFMKCSMPDGVLYDAVIVGIDPTGDVALIQLLGRNDFPSATIANSDGVQVGDECFAVGNPFLLATDFQPSVSWGIVSGTHRYQYPSGTLLEYADCIQTDAAINPGNSGGALFDAAGELIGINGRGSFEKRGRVNVGVGYAISINQISNFIDHLASGRIVDHATLGATVRTDNEGKVRIANILESSDAYRRGIQIDDQVLFFAGREIQTVNQFKNVLGIYPQGWRVLIVLRRSEGENGEFEFETTVRLTGVHAAGQLAEKIQGRGSQKSQDKLPRDQGDMTEVESTNVPEKFAHMFVARYGFANFYFNQARRDQIWGGFRKHGDFSKENFNWHLTGALDDGSPISAVLTDTNSGIQIGDETYVLEEGLDLADQLQSPGTGGLLVALHLWRIMLVNGPERFGEVIYFGSIPASTNNGEADVLTATREGIECGFLFDSNDQRLTGIEMFPDVDKDPCVLRFANYQVNGDLTVPGEISFSTGDQASSVFQIKQIEFLENGK